MNSSSLGILIPSWDRPAEVQKRLAEITCQFGSDQRVHLQINPGVYGLGDLRVDRRHSAVTAAENKSNVGFVANILLGLMSLDKEWLWILGDDDSLSADCAAIMDESLSMAAAETIAIVHNQWCREPIYKQRCRVTAELLASTLFGDVLFISGTVWRRSFFLSRLELFVRQSYSCASQVAVLIDGLETGAGEVLVLNRPLIDYQPVHRWSRLEFVKCMPTLLDGNMSGQTRGKLAYLMYPQWRWACSSALQEVGLGQVSLQKWLGVSVATLLKLLLCDPWIFLRESMRGARLVRARFRDRQRVQLAILKGKLKGWLNDYRRFTS